MPVWALGRITVNRKKLKKFKFNLTIRRFKLIGALLPTEYDGNASKIQSELTNARNYSIKLIFVLNLRETHLYTTACFYV